MITYRDMTFCKNKDCAKFSDEDCHRAWTDERSAECPDDMPVCFYSGKPGCYSTNEEEKG